MAIISKRGKKEVVEKNPTKPWPFPKPGEPEPTDIGQIEINFAEFDDHPINRDGQQEEFEYYKEDWVIQHKSALYAASVAPTHPFHGCMTIDPHTNVVSVWSGTEWLTFDYYHLQNLLQPKTQRVTMGQHEYEVVTK